MSIKDHMQLFYQFWMPYYGYNTNTKDYKSLDYHFRINVYKAALILDLDAITWILYKH